MASSLDQAIGGPTPAKIILKQSTGMSLNDRFTMLNNKPRTAPSAAALPPTLASVSVQPRVQRAQVVRNAQQQAREHMLQSRRQPQPLVQPPLHLRLQAVSPGSSGRNERTLKSRLGQGASSGVKQRLGGGGPSRGSSQPLQVRQIPLFRPARSAGAPVRERLGAAARGPRRVDSGRRTLRGRGPLARVGRARSAAAASASAYGGFEAAGRGRPRVRRGALTGRQRESDKQAALSKDELDKQLDSYMNKSKAQLDTFMASNAMQS